MLAWLVLAIFVIVGFYFVARWFVSAQPSDVLRVLRWVGGVIAVVGLAAIALSGRWNFIWALLFPALPFLMRLRALNAMRRNARGPRAGQSSRVNTRFLHMNLDHDTGDMDGEIRQGPAAGRVLSALKLGELVDLWRLCASEDEQSRVVLESYLDRNHVDWRDVAGGGAQRGSRESGDSRSPWTQTGMSVEEAREVLGVDENASESDIEAAYRAEMKRAHPDQGGSDWMAAKVNQAKDIILGR
ncbi:MAG TPA: molecular chaperone DnaJ [Rhodospirillaceae bacterium]|nr:molecular chaperone DnaJ [Rhodospirillaceae bacterium]